MLSRKKMPLRSRETGDEINIVNQPLCTVLIGPMWRNLPLVARCEASPLGGSTGGIVQRPMRCNVAASTGGLEPTAQA
jgi:hypothetical protein